MKFIPFSVLTLLSAITISTQAQTLSSQFQSLVDSVYQSRPEALGILIHVEAGDQGISWTYATGYADTSRADKLKVDQPVLLASNTKPYVAAATLRLIEMGHFKLDDPIVELLTPNTVKTLERGGYDLNAINVKHLLSHTSGIHDYVDKAYFQMVLDEPQYQWSRQKQIERVVEVGKPLAEPGTQFSYGDINFILLTEIMEVQMEKPFYEAMPELLKYEALGIKSTWFYQLEKTPESSAPLAHQYAKDFRLDSYEINPSWDLYGGGGIASTTQETALFFQNLFLGNIIEDPELLKAMTSYVLPIEESKYCLGVFHFDFGYNLYYHGGWWGTDVNYSPETNTSVSVFTLVRPEAKKINPFIGKRVHELILEAQKDEDN